MPDEIGHVSTVQRVAEGSLPLSYQWLRNGTVLSDAGSPTLTLNSSSLALGNVTLNLSGDYQVVITNLFGCLTSQVARLTVRELSLLEVRLGQAMAASNAFRFEVTGPVLTNYVVWGSPDFAEWTPLSTNFVIDGWLEFVDPADPLCPRRFYRVSLEP